MTWEVMMEPVYREISDDLPAEIFLNERWFAEKSHYRGRLRLADALFFKRSGLDGAIGFNLFQLEAEEPERFYFIPFLITRQPRETAPWFLKNGYYGYDGIPTFEYISLITQCFQRRRSFPAAVGSFNFYPIGEFAPTQFDIHGSSSNSLLFVSANMLIKNYRLIFAGTHPELEVGTALARNGSNRIPEIYGYLQYQSGIRDYTLLITQELVANQGTAWEIWESSLENDPSGKALMTDAFSLGETIAGLHLELAEMSRKLEQYQPMDQKRLAEKIDRLSEIIQNDLGEPLKDTVDLALEKLYALRQNLGVTDWGRRFRIHGDLHLEQVLKTAFGWKVIDFEGEPLKSISERGNWDSPLKDVASLLRSVSYRIHSLGAVAHMDCETELQQQIMGGYLNVYHQLNGQFLPDDAVVDKLLGLFQFERVIYEYLYELKYRPDWVRIPEAGLRRLLEKN